MHIFIEENKGDFIYHDWEEESVKQMNNKFKELEEQGFKACDVQMDYLNTYYYYQNDIGEKVLVTLLCS